MPLLHRLSLMHGWLPPTLQVVAAVVLATAIGWRTRRWRLLWLPLAAVVGIATAAGTYRYIVVEGLSDNPAPHGLWIWIALSGVAVAVLITGWAGARWWRRGMSVLAVPLALLCAAVALNLWVGYFPSVGAAWNQLTAGPLPDQTDESTVAAMVQRHAMPPNGTVVPVTIGDTASGFKHRTELVYLPPAWFATNPAPRLPTVMMIGGEFNTPGDWARAGNAVKTLDDFAAAHHGNAPVVVFVDAGGTFNNDTECVNGTRGNVADHLTKEVVPYMESKFGVSDNASQWGIVGWSMGGTCAVDLAVMHPDLFSAFEDIAGDITPNSGDKNQTIARLYGGSAAQWAAFDPTTVINRHGPYGDVEGWFDVNSPLPPANLLSSPAPVVPAKLSDQMKAADSLCGAGSANGIRCAVVTQPGNHDWPFAAQAFATALPWLAAQLETPGLPPGELPGAPKSAPYVQTSGKVGQ